MAHVVNDAVVAQVSEYARSPVQFAYVRRALPPLRANEVAIEVSAASVNPLDLRMAEGYGRRVFARGAGGRLPLQLGRDGSGIVTHVGAKVDRLRVGMRVWFALPPFHAGSYATRIHVDSALVAELPEGMSALDAASLPYAGVTALEALDDAQLSERTSRGRRVFVHGASGGVGMIACAVLHAWGAQLCMSASPASFEILRARVPAPCVDSRGELLMGAVHECDTAVDLVGQAQTLLRALPRGGRYVTTVTPVLGLLDEYGIARGLVTAGVRKLHAQRDAGARGIRHRWTLFKASTAKLEQLSELVRRGALSAPPVEVHSFERLHDAHAAAMRSPRVGKVVLSFPG